MSTKQRVFYIVSISTDDLNRKYGQHFFVGAATNKVLGVCSALRSAGVFPVIVSGAIPTSLAKFYRCSKHIRTAGVCYAKVFSAFSGLFKRILIGISVTFYLIRYIRSQDKVLFYNYYPDYILPALYLKLIGRPAILDIEDGPRLDEPGIRALSNRIALEILLPLCSKKYVTVSRDLGEKLELDQFLPINGVAPYFDAYDEAPDKFAADKIRILFGGTINRGTGLYLFMDGVKRLAATEPELPLHFVITGIFLETEIRRFSKEIEDLSQFRIAIHSDLTAADYRMLAREMDIGLSLRLSEHSIGQTTFPSKVIEYAAMGMLVCTTSVSDIHYIFDDSTAIVLDRETPEALAAALSDAARNRIRSAKRAKNGRLRILERFSKEVIGRSIVEFICD